MESKEKFGKVRFPGWLFLILTVVYNELLLHFWITEQIQPGRLLVVLAFALGFGGILALLTSMISSEKAVKWVSIGLAVIVAVIWLMEYFISDAYKTFMTPATIFSGAGGVAKDYLEGSTPSWDTARPDAFRAKTMEEKRKNPLAGASEEDIF